MQYALMPEGGPYLPLFRARAASQDYGNVRPEYTTQDPDLQDPHTALLKFQVVAAFRLQVEDSSGVMGCQMGGAITCCTSRYSKSATTQ